MSGVLLACDDVDVSDLLRGSYMYEIVTRKLFPSNMSLPDKTRIPRYRHRHPRRHPRQDVGVGVGVVECELNCTNDRAHRTVIGGGGISFRHPIIRYMHLFRLLVTGGVHTAKYCDE